MISLCKLGPIGAARLTEAPQLIEPLRFIEAELSQVERSCVVVRSFVVERSQGPLTDPPAAIVIRIINIAVEAPTIAVGPALPLFEAESLCGAGPRSGEPRVFPTMVLQEEGGVYRIVVADAVARRATPHAVNLFASGIHRANARSVLCPGPATR